MLRGSECGAPCWRAWSGPSHQCTQCWVMTITQCEVKCFSLQCCGKVGFHLVKANFVFLNNPFFCVLFWLLFLVWESVLSCLFLLVFRASPPDPPPPDPPPPDPPPPDPPPPDCPKFRSFFPFPSIFILFFPLFLSFSWNVFEDRDPQMCTFGLSGCRVKPRRPHKTGSPGLAHDTENSKCAHLTALALPNTTKIPLEDPQRGKERTNFVAGE